MPPAGRARGMQSLLQLIACAVFLDITNGQIAYPSLRKPKLKPTTTTTSTTTTPTPVTASTTAPPQLTTWGRTRHPKFTGDPQHDWEFDPNLPRELNGYNMTGYPFFSRVPEKVKYDCRGKIDGFYANVNYSCQVYHHCLYGIRQDFLCGNYTAFDMRTFICQFINLVDCENSDTYTYRNEPLYKFTTTKAPRKKRPFRRRFEDYYDYYDYYTDESLDNYTQRRPTTSAPIRKKPRNTQSRLLARIKSKQTKKKPAKTDYSYRDDYYYDYYADSYYDDYYYDEPATATTTTTTTTRRPVRRRRPGAGGRRRRPAARRRITDSRRTRRPDFDYYSDYDLRPLESARQRKRNRLRPTADYSYYEARAASSPNVNVALAAFSPARADTSQSYPDYDAEDILEYPVRQEREDSRVPAPELVRKRAGTAQRSRVRPQLPAAPPRQSQQYYTDDIRTSIQRTPQTQLVRRVSKPAPPPDRASQPAPAPRPSAGSLSPSSQSLSSALNIPRTILPPARDAENEVLEPERRRAGSRDRLKRRRPVRVQTRVPPQTFSDSVSFERKVERGTPVFQRANGPSRGRRRFQAT